MDSNVRKGKRESFAKRRARELGSDDLSKALDKIEKEVSRPLDPEKDRDKIISKNVKEFFERSNKKPDSPWETERKGLAPGGELLTLQDLINLKPFSTEGEMRVTIAFRAPESMWRAAERVREGSGKSYDIASDMYREAFRIGLLVISERHKEILGLELVLDRAEARQKMKEDARKLTRRLKEVLQTMEKEAQIPYFQDYMTAMAEKPRWLQETHLEEIKSDKFLSGLLDGLQEPD